MTEFDSVDAILDFAIGEEEKAARFYTDLAGRMSRPGMKKTFEEFTREEMKHKEKLLAIKSGKQLAAAPGRVMDLKIADYTVDVEPTPDMEYQDALILAMKKEKAAFRMYNDLAASTDNGGLKATLLSLAQEEAKHKLRFEIEYDEAVMREN